MLAPTFSRLATALAIVLQISTVAVANDSVTSSSSTASSSSSTPGVMWIESTVVPTDRVIVPTLAPDSNSTLRVVGENKAEAEPKYTTPCNGHIELCNRSYGELTYVAAHNSMFIQPNSAAANQNLNVTRQLNDGIRMLQGQVHLKNEVIHYCHSSCDLLDAGPLENYLKTVVEWLKTNPDEVISILIGNGDYSDVERFVDPLQASGIVEYLYTPKNTTEVIKFDKWPTLGELIKEGKRVILYMDYEADQERVPYILNQFKYMWETPFSQTDQKFPCNVDRPPGQIGSEDKMYMANHNLNAELQVFGDTVLMPDKVNLNTTNGEKGFGSLGLAAEKCASLWGRPPTFLLVDFYEVGGGSVFKVAAKANGVEYDNKCCSTDDSESAAPATQILKSLGLHLFLFSLVVTVFA